VVAAVSFLLARLYFGHRRWWLGFPIALLALFAVGELTIQARRPDTTDQRPLALTNGEEVFVTAIPAGWQTSRQPRNKDSLVIRLAYRGSSILLEGDAERPVEQRMAALHNLKSDLLKVLHHGNATTSTSEFVRAVRPRWAIISVGTGNSFGHPCRETLQHLQEVAMTYRTDGNGAVTFYLDGQSVIPQLACLR